MTPKRPLSFKIILVAWSLILIFLTIRFRSNDWSDETLAKRLSDAQSKMLSYKRELGEARLFLLHKSIYHKSLKETLRRSLKIEPTREYEIYRRRVYRDVQEMWFYVRSKLESVMRIVASLRLR